MTATPHPAEAHPHPHPIRLTRTQVREVDRLAIERYHIPGIVLMENASRAVADEACDLLEGECCGQVLILCGGGNNGGDGLAAARHLHNRGAEVIIALATDPAGYKGDALTNWRIVQAMGFPVAPAEPALIERPGPLLIIDAIFGTGLDRPPRDPFPLLVKAIERTHLPVLAVDVPSGLDCDTGKPFGACIRATRTVTFVTEKAGFAEPQARHWLGDVVVGDIGCPVELIEEVAKVSPPASPP
jgi:NAD(P)H-hydrate epimerase